MSQDANSQLLRSFRVMADLQFREDSPQERPREPTVKAHSTRRHLLVNDELWEKAKREGLSVGDLVNWALRSYLGAGK